MSWSKVIPVLLIVGLIALILPLTIALADDTGVGTVRVRDNGDTLSTLATIDIIGSPPLAANQTLEGWFVSEDGSRKVSTGILKVDADGNISQTAMLPVDLQSITIGLDEQNSSGQSGTATLTAVGDTTRVDLSITAGAMETEAVHIHVGPCGNAPILGGVVHPLTSFVGGSGTSTTIIPAELNSLLTGGFAINSHQAGNVSVYTACGNVPQRDPESLTIALAERNSSGQSGTATLTASGDQTSVVVSVTPAADSGDEPQPIHIHVGSCGADLGGVHHPLISVVGGQSNTVVDATLRGLMDGNHAINLHKSGPQISVYTSCGEIPLPGPSGENIFDNFDKFVVTIEPLFDDNPGPSGVFAAKAGIPAGGFVHIGHLLVSWKGNPVYTSGFYAGKNIPKGIAVGLREQTLVALTHARLSLGGDDLANRKLHACHVVNIIEGTGGTNFDGSCGNPGDGFGVLAYAADTAKHANLAGGAAPADRVITGHGKEVVASANQVDDWATQARNLAVRATKTTSVDAATLAMEGAEGLLVKSWNGFDADKDGTIERITGEGGAKQAYWASQDMGTFLLIPTAVDDPSVGDANVPRAAMISLLAGAFLLLVGGFILRRSRSRRLHNMAG